MRLPAGRRRRGAQTIERAARSGIEHHNVPTGHEGEHRVRVLAIEEHHVRPDRIRARPVTAECRRLGGEVDQCGWLRRRRARAAQFSSGKDVYRAAVILPARV